MKTPVFNRDLVNALCKENALAADFVIQAHAWFHAIDDIVDGELPQATDTGRRQAVVKAFAAGIVVLSHDFYLRNLPALRMSLLQVSQTYALSVEFETSAEEWKRRWADTQRHCGMDLLVAVAMICGGWQHAQEQARLLAEGAELTC